MWRGFIIAFYWMLFLLHGHLNRWCIFQLKTKRKRVCADINTISIKARSNKIHIKNGRQWPTLDCTYWLWWADETNFIFSYAFCVIWWSSLVGNGSGYQWAMPWFLWARPRFCRNATVFLSEPRLFLSYSRHVPDIVAKMARFKLIYSKYNPHIALNCAQEYPGYGY